MWDECNYVVVWAFFGISFLWDWNENWPFRSCGHCWVFQICWHIECSTFTASSFRIWNSSTGIPSPSLALFIVMLSKLQIPGAINPEMLLMLYDAPPPRIKLSLALLESPFSILFPHSLLASLGSPPSLHHLHLEHWLWRPDLIKQWI